MGYQESIILLYSLREIKSVGLVDPPPTFLTVCHESPQDVKNLLANRATCTGQSATLVVLYLLNNKEKWCDEVLNIAD